MSQTEVQFQHAVIGNSGKAESEDAAQFRPTRHPGADWYTPAGLGMFIHWGIASVTGYTDLSWAMVRDPQNFAAKKVERYGLPARNLSMAPEHYWALAERFTADRYDPEKWLAAAAAAGIRYCVLTTRHHDGFALWPSNFGEFSTRNYLGGRDLVGEYVAACRKYGLKIGFYYSPPDWRQDRDYMNFCRDAEHPIGTRFEPRTPKPRTAEHLEEIRRYRRGQIEELLTRYGQIDYLWFDGYCDECITFARLRELQPHLLVNDRGMHYGDVITEGSECQLPPQRPAVGRRWEYCHVFQDGAWGYLDYEVYKPMGWFLAELAKARTWDGNFLPNVSPDSHGELPAPYYRRMEQLAAWMKENAHTVCDVAGLPRNECCNVAVTTRGNRRYLHADWLCDFPIELGGITPPEKVTLRGATIPYHYANGTLTIEVPLELKTNLTDIIEIIL